MSADAAKDKSKVTIKIPRRLYNQLVKIVEGSGFNSVTDFIVYVLRDLVSTPQMSKLKTRLDEGDSPEEKLTKDEIELIRQRLKSLGYW